jgi:predicted AlkP superfamily phosphohydrolase/phosphomutase
MSARMVLVALDAVDLTLLRRGVDAGEMPVMGDLLSRGSFGRLNSVGRWLAGSVWPTFWTSTPPSQHGFHHYLQWSAERMAMERPDPVMPGLMPFWRQLEALGARIAAIDMPFAPRPTTGIELCGWSSLDSLETARSHPPEFLREVCAVFGRGVARSEPYALQPATALLALRDEHVRLASDLAALSERLLRREPFDLFTICLPGPHRCGHRLWDETGVAGTLDQAAGKELAGALAQVYRATDAALGRILAAATADEVLVYSVHGMGPNTSRIEILDQMLARILRPPTRHGGYAGWARLRAAVPAPLRAALKRRMSTRWQDRMTGYWRTGGRDWSQVQALSLVADLAGYIRLNRAGRERAGILSADAADEVAEQIADGLASFVDADSGEPLVRETVRVERRLPEGPGRNRLPDLIVDWSPTPAARHRRIVSQHLGEIAWPTPGRHPSGRSGNHRSEGFYLALGAGLAPGAGPEGDILDLAPTVMSRLGAAVPTAMTGRPLFGPKAR